MALTCSLSASMRCAGSGLPMCSFSSVCVACHQAQKPSIARSVSFIPKTLAWAAFESLMRATTVAGTVALVAALGCGGDIWNKAQARNWAEMTTDLEAATEGPNRDTVAGMIDEAYIRTVHNEIGFSEISSFRMALREAVQDGELSDAEVSELRALGGPWVHPPLHLGDWQQAERAVLLVEKREIEAEYRAEQAEKAARSFGDWGLPEDLRERMEAAGVKVEQCDSNRWDDGMRQSDCEGPLGDDFAEVTVETYTGFADAHDAMTPWRGAAKSRDGTAVMWVLVSDRAESKALAEEILSQHARIDQISIRSIKKAAEARGFDNDLTVCSDYTDSGRSYIDCELEKGHFGVDVAVSVPPGREPLRGARDPLRRPGMAHLRLGRPPRRERALGGEGGGAHGEAAELSGRVGVLPGRAPRRGARTPGPCRGRRRRACSCPSRPRRCRSAGWGSSSWVARRPTAYSVPVSSQRCTMPVVYSAT